MTSCVAWTSCHRVTDVNQIVTFPHSYGSSNGGSLVWAFLDIVSGNVSLDHHSSLHASRVPRRCSKDHNLSSGQGILTFYQSIWSPKYNQLLTKKRSVISTGSGGCSRRLTNRFSWYFSSKDTWKTLWILFAEVGNSNS